LAPIQVRLSRSSGQNEIVLLRRPTSLECMRSFNLVEFSAVWKTRGSLSLLLLLFLLLPLFLRGGLSRCIVVYGFHRSLPDLDFVFWISSSAYVNPEIVKFLSRSRVSSASSKLPNALLFTFELSLFARSRM